MEKLRLPAQSSMQAPSYEDAVSLLEKNMVLEQDVADSVERTLSGFEREYLRLIKDADKDSK